MPSPSSTPGIAAYLAGDAATATECALRSLELHAWQPAAALASLALCDLDRPDEAATYLSSALTESFEPAGPEWDDRIRMLAPAAMIRQLQQALDEMTPPSQEFACEVAQLGAEMDRLQHRSAVMAEAFTKGQCDDWAGARRVLKPFLVGDGAPQAAALDALAAAKLAAPDDATAVARAEDLLAVGPAEMASEAHQNLAEAEFLLGRVDSAAEHWRASLEASEPFIWVDADILALAAFGDDAGAGPIAAASKDFSTRASPDEAAYRACVPQMRPTWVRPPAICRERTSCSTRVLRHSVRPRMTNWREPAQGSATRPAPRRTGGPTCPCSARSNDEWPSSGWNPTSVTWPRIRRY